MPIILEGLGTVTPISTVTLKSQVDGRLVSVSFREGQTVRRGELLAQIDPRPFLIQLHAAQAARARDEAQLHEARLNLDRYHRLGAEGIIPQQQLDDQKALAIQLAATVRTDQAQIEQARLQLEYSRIVSPIDGITGVRQVDPGNLVHVGDATGIVVVTQIDPISVLFTLPQDDHLRVLKQLQLAPIPVDAYSRDGATLLESGTLTVMDNQINTTTASIRLRAVFSNPHRMLWPNAFAKARLRLSTRKGALVVPAAAVQRGPQGSFVYVVNADDSVAMRPIEVAFTQGELSIIEKGLSPGERVVSDGQNQLKPGSAIAPRVEKPP